MQVIKNLYTMQDTAEKMRLAGNRIAVVPTMGFLHAGHLSLIRRAREMSDVVITTVFVNPTQFGPHEDFRQYPRDFERDEQLARENGTDILFCPDSSDMYPRNYLTYVTVDEITTVLCGASRPTHFRGVTTVVTKLFHLTQPHVAVFGQKDAQQAFIIRRMVRDLNMNVEIVLAPIVREADGLALSSRNIYLSASERQQAVVLYQSLQLARQMIRQGERHPQIILAAMKKMIEEKPATKIDYLAIVDTEKLKPVNPITAEILIAEAVQFSQARLIDNIILTVNPENKAF